MRQVIRVVMAVVIASLSAGGGVSVGLAAPSPTIVLDETIHVATSDGGDLAVPSGRYQVEQAESQLLLIGSEGQVRLTVAAAPVRHQQEVEASQAFAFRIVPDQFQIVLLLAGGRGWAVQGSAGEVRTRGTGILSAADARILGGGKAFTLPSERELLQEALTKLDALAKQVGPVAQIAQQVNDLQNGKMGFLIQETNRNAYRVCEIVGAHMWGGPAIGCRKQ